MIRRMVPEDADAVAETFIASFETLLTFLPNLHTHEEHRRFVTEIVPLDHQIWVAERDGRVVGFAASASTRSGTCTSKRACRFYERHGLRAIAHGDGSGNEEGVPDVRYEWRPE